MLEILNTALLFFNIPRNHPLKMYLINSYNFDVHFNIVYFQAAKWNN